ncbi:glycoside hydrolase family 5 protein [Mycena amicta]|nr:glycoside hydrolase family 5 protein [Mycena amicta]
MSPLLHILFALVYFLPASLAALPGFPSKIYGVNLGSWLVLESWMLPQEWINMGGQQCDDCSSCIATEFAFAQAFPDTVDEKFEKHWQSWFNQNDVDALVSAGINTVRIPLGYWIVEPLVDRQVEFYPRGGLAQLRRGLQLLHAAGIVAILDHHALPGVQTANQMFTGRCTSDVEFYTPSNYHRALIWTAVMTTLAHVDPSFANAVAIEAVNEPIMDASQTPGYGEFQKSFVRVIRATEYLLGLPTPGFPAVAAPANGNFSQILPQITDTANLFTDEVRSVLRDTVPILLKMGVSGASRRSTPLVSNFMDVNWQHNNPVNPSDAQIGPQGYDNHLYYSFGGVADPNPDAYLTSICNLNRVQADAALGDSPLWFGEWGLPTQFDATDDFLIQWADAQKLAYSQGVGWIFWNFKVEKSTLAGNLSRQWSYLDGVRLGYLTKDPSKLHDPDVCVPYLV